MRERQRFEIRPGQLHVLCLWKARLVVYHVWVSVLSRSHCDIYSALYYSIWSNIIFAIRGHALFASTYIINEFLKIRSIHPKLLLLAVKHRLYTYTVNVIIIISPYVNRSCLCQHDDLINQIIAVVHRSQ